MPAGVKVARKGFVAAVFVKLQKQEIKNLIAEWQNIYSAAKER